MKLRWILKTGEWALLCLERRFKSSVITVFVCDSKEFLQNMAFSCLFK